MNNLFRIFPSVFVSDISMLFWFQTLSSFVMKTSCALFSLLILCSSLSLEDRPFVLFSRACLWNLLGIVCFILRLYFTYFYCEIHNLQKKLYIKFIWLYEEIWLKNKLLTPVSTSQLKNTTSLILFEASEHIPFSPCWR